MLKRLQMLILHNFNTLTVKKMKDFLMPRIEMWKTHWSLFLTNSKEV